MFADAETWAVGPGQAGKVPGLVMHTIRNAENRYPTWQPCLLEDLGKMRILFEPSLYNGTSEDQRVNIVMSIGDETAAEIAKMEELVRDKLRAHVPHVDQIWNSCLRPPSDRGGGTLKAKLRVRNEGAVQCFNKDREEIPRPTTWKGYSICPLIETRSIYVQARNAGLVLEVTAAVLGDNPNQKATCASVFK